MMDLFGSILSSKNNPSPRSLHYEMNEREVEKSPIGDVNVVLNSGEIKESEGDSMKDFTQDLEDVFLAVEMDENAKKAIVKHLNLKLKDAVSYQRLEAKLKLLYSYELNYLSLIKDYKEEIKFLSSLQEELRKERTKFFAESLKEVSQTLKDSHVEAEVASIWVKELVESFTKSVNLSEVLIEDSTINTIGQIKDQIKNEKSTIDIADEL